MTWSSLLNYVICWLYEASTWRKIVGVVLWPATARVKKKTVATADFINWKLHYTIFENGQIGVQVSEKAAWIPRFMFLKHTEHKCINLL